MIHSLFLMLSSYNSTNKKFFKLIWIMYVIIKYFHSFDFVFLIINLSTFLFVTKLICCISKFYSPLNKILSVISILIYSLFIDVICYYMLPTWNWGGQSLFMYVTNGFLFNYKYVFFNIFTLLIFEFFFDKIRTKTDVCSSLRSRC